MKKKKTIWFILMLCWWGFLFPELTFTEDSLRVVYVGAKGEVQSEGEQMEASQWDKYVDFLNADPEQVKVKSKLLEWLNGLW